MWVMDVDGGGRRVEVPAGIAVGFVGRVRYGCDGDAGQAAQCHALLAFGEMAGVGSHSAHGLGRVRVNPIGTGPKRSIQRP